MDSDGQWPMDSGPSTAWPVRLPAPPSAGPVRTGAAPRLAAGFTPRPETAPGLAVALVPGVSVALVPAPGAAQPVPGTAGPCGKTQLAVSFAGELWRAGEVDLLAWVTATSRASVLSGYIEAAAAVGIGPADHRDSAEQVAARFAGWLGQTPRRWLIVLDDLRDAADLAGLWPAGPAGRVLITAPAEETVPGLFRARILPVGSFSPREAMMYLMGCLTTDPDQRRGAIGLVEDLACDPAALAQAGAVIASSALMTCLDYQQSFSQRLAQLTLPGGEPPPAAAATWTLSAEQAGQAAQLALGFAALLDGHSIPGTVFSTPATCHYLAASGTAVGPVEAWNTVLSLEQTGLLDIDRATTPPTVRVSNTVQAQVRVAMPEAVTNRAARAAADALLEAWPADEPLPWLAAGLRSCVASLQDAATDRLWAANSPPHPVLLRAGQSLDRAQLTGPAVSHWSQLTALSDKYLGLDSPSTLALGSHLARALMAAGQATEAVSWWQWVVAGQTRISGPGHPSTIAARVSLGRTLAAAGQPGAAVAMLREAAADDERVCGPDHLDTLNARDELAAACRLAGELAEATALYRRILTDRERVQGHGHPDVTHARDKLASTCLENGRPKEAVSLGKRTLADQQRTFGPDHLDTIAAQANLATAYYSAGKIGTALQLQEEACAGYERVLGAGHPHTLTSRADLARAYHASGRIADAANLLRDAIARCEQSLPPEHPLIQALRQARADIAGG